MLIMYAVIAEPPSLGGTQVIVTLASKFTEVVGAIGVTGEVNKLVTVDVINYYFLVVGLPTLLRRA